MRNSSIYIKHTELVTEIALADLMGGAALFLTVYKKIVANLNTRNMALHSPPIFDGEDLACMACLTKIRKLF